jgi:PST family polysaccharide transporter
LVIGNADSIIVGKILGAEMLGYYTIAYGIMMKPIQFIFNSLGRIFFPAFSSIKQQKNQFKDLYLKLLNAVSLFVFPLMAGAFFVAPVLFKVVYGDKWLPGVPIFKILCFVGAIEAVGMFAAGIFYSLGKAEIDLKIKIASVPLYILGFLVGALYELKGVAWAYFLISLFVWPWKQIYACRLIGVSNWEYFRSLQLAGVASVVMYLFLRFMESVQIMNSWYILSDIFYLFVVVGIGIIIYFTTILIISKNTFKEILGYIKF